MPRLWSSATPEHESLESTKIYTQVSFQRTRRIAELFGSPGEVK